MLTDLILEDEQGAEVVGYFSGSLRGIAGVRSLS